MTDGVRDQANDAESSKMSPPLALTVTLNDDTMSSTNVDRSPTDIGSPLLHDDPAAADSARQRLAPRKSLSLPFRHAFSRRTASRVACHQSSGSASSDSLARRLYVADPNTSVDDLAPQLIVIHEGELYLNTFDDNHDKDVYRWAVLYENQRG